MLAKMHQRLIEVTDGCNQIMHEPDQQGVTAVVRGDHLDNAMGDNPANNADELTIGISRDDGQSYEWFNLASLIALARMAEPKA